MTSNRISVYTGYGITSRLYVLDCPNCGVIFGVTDDYDERRREDHRNFYCPNGHSQHYSGPSDAQKLRAAEAREVALNDQLSAAIREGESTRQALLRDRDRFSKGVCVCCNRSFENVRRHMATQHPDFDIAHVAEAAFRCSCGSKFTTFAGLRIHQGRLRAGNWDSPKARSWDQHLTRT